MNELQSWERHRDDTVLILESCSDRWSHMWEAAELFQSEQGPRSRNFPLQHISAFCTLRSQGNLLTALLDSYAHPGHSFS